MQNKALFLDRDGTIIEDCGYLSDASQLEFIPGVPQALRHWQKAGYLPVLVTNQSGIARGYFSEEHYLRIHQALLNLLQREGITLAGAYYCPHHPSEGHTPYTCDCQCRKPLPGMFLQAQFDLNLNFSQSWAVGDRWRDLQAPAQLGCHTGLLLTGAGREELSKLDPSVPKTLKSLELTPCATQAYPTIVRADLLTLTSQVLP